MSEEKFKKYENFYFYISNEEKKEVKVCKSPYSSEHTTGDIVIPTIIEYSGKKYTVVGFGSVESYSIKTTYVSDNRFKSGQRETGSYRIKHEHCGFADTKIKSVFIPHTITNIDGAFENCEYLTKINIDPKNPNYASVDGVVFSKDLTKIILCPLAIESLFIPKETQKCKLHELLSKCSCITKISVDTKNVNYTSIDDVVYDKNITEIQLVPNKKEIVLERGLTSINNRFFKHCSKLRSITIPDGIAHFHHLEDFYPDVFFPSNPWVRISIESIESFLNQNTWRLRTKSFPHTSLIHNGSNVKNVVIPETITTIPQNAFFNIQNIQSITISNGVTEIGEGAFKECTSLKSIVIPNSVTKIGESAFYGCTSLESITIPDSVTFIGKEVFSKCTSLKSITIPNSVTKIGYAAFSDCTSLESITIPNSVKEIKTDVFCHCKRLRSITIPNSVTKIESSAFSNCEYLKLITLPNKLTEIGSNAFYNCKYLESIIIPNSVKTIGHDAFSLCGYLKSIIIPEGVTYIGEKAFSYCCELKTVIIQNGKAKISEDIFYYCRNLEEVIIVGKYIKKSYFKDLPHNCKVTCLCKMAFQIRQKGFLGWIKSLFSK